MKPPKCTFCEKVEWRHVCATNTKSVATNVATNKANGETPLDQPLIPVAEKSAGVDSPERRTENRRSRESYNAYQRSYMQIHRAVKSGRAELLRS